MPDFAEPQSRNEAILQNCLGADNDLGEPQSRIEELLMELLDALSGGTGSAFVINFSLSHGVYSADKTFAEVEAAIEDGKICIVKYSNDTAYLVEFDGTTAIFESIAENYVDSYRINDDESCDHYFYTLEKQALSVNSSLTTPTIDTATNNTIYSFGELTSLTVTALGSNASFIIRFTSGSTPTTTNFPASMVFPEAFAAEANMRYEINCVDGYALVASWPTT